MAKIAVIKTGGKQYKVKEGETIKIEKLAHSRDNHVRSPSAMPTVTKK